MNSNYINKNLFTTALFLVPFFLLWTKNFSVIVIAILSVYSIYYLVKTKIPLKINAFDYLVMMSLGIYLIVNIPNFIIDTGQFRYFQGGIRLALCIPIYLFIKHNFSEKTIPIKALSLGVVWGAFGSFFIAIYQYFLLGLTRVDGWLYSINFGYLSCSLAFLSVCLSPSSPYKWWLRISFVAACISTCLTFTRGAIFAIPILIMFIALLNWNYLSFKKVVSVIFTFSFLMLISCFISSNFKERINFTIKEFAAIASGNINYSVSSGGRIQLWEAASKAFIQSPLIGLTYPEREALNKKLSEQEETTRSNLDIKRGHAHSQYFEMLASNGLLGIIGLIGTLFLPLTIFSRNYLRTRSITALSAATFVAGFTIYSLTEVLLQANLISAFYGFMLATFFALIQIER
ncbi:hypothetical protein CF67_06028 [Candidatus Photodesmus blepharus]|uniref:O-antigen ligase-related domain-containing protein n=1 Tax=Candidatus Photodesmus blepharonis TaxID=1179155 RepID=A0A084CME3_9GAMM|nr:O-antigen ligase family protein [Candidatus Photodesmus blepharus]KEY90972.1 hypothetical protein CF67_06028 [Candidatus Photodesmus blepharus]